ncbi:UNVERIFIED_CONTAM: hypothetical protein FKN15_063573 [Acipenser sinensis]
MRQWGGGSLMVAREGVSRPSDKEPLQQGIGRKQEKKSKKAKSKTHQKIRQRAQGPNKVIHRYKRILCTYKKTKIMTKALCRHTLERKTVVSTALIAQLAIAAPEKYKELAASHSGK